MKNSKNKNESHYIRNFMTGILGLLLVIFILMVAPDYTRTDITDKTNLIINNNNVTASLKKDVIIDDRGVIYISKQDLTNFFDSYMYFDQKYNQIITTSDTKTATLPIGEKVITINGAVENILGAAYEEDETYYLPFSLL